MIISLDEYRSQAQSNTERSRRFREKRKAERQPYNSTEYLARRFVPIDGEGINVRSGPRKGEHDYVLLAIHNVAPIMRKDGLRTHEILDYLWRNLTSDTNNVVYGASYDWNCWLRDIPEDKLRLLYRKDKQSSIRYGAYTIRFMQGKKFTIKRDGRSVTVYDVVSFFQLPFVAACDEYLGKEWVGRDTIIAEKKRRGDFTWHEIRKIGRYNQLELDRLKDLCDELRLRLNRVGLRPRTWIGPGSVAASLFLREGVKDHMTRDTPVDVSHAVRTAYAGGRFECLKHGISTDPAWEYDVNSAYPKALSLVPSLAGGTWEKVTGTPHELFSLWHIRWESHSQSGLTLPGPLFVRAGNGTISYPMRGEGWYWGPEAMLCEEYARAHGTTFTYVEGYIFHPASSDRPFGFIPALYERRKALKAAGDGAHIGLKIALNSCYGKLAQQIGWNRYTNSAPTFHQLEWAGFTTSWCRARVLSAALQDPGAVIAFETDALFTTRPLELPVSDRLGEWEETRFSSLTYVQSGHYYGTLAEGGDVVSRMRGVDRGQITREAVEERMRIPLAYRHMEAHVTRFRTLGIALARSMRIWRRWEDETKTLALYPMGKRVPWDADWREGWMTTYCPVKGGISAEYPIEWETPNPEMTKLAHLREDGYDYE